MDQSPQTVINQDLNFINSPRLSSNRGGALPSDDVSELVGDDFSTMKKVESRFNVGQNKERSETPNDMSISQILNNPKTKSKEFTLAASNHKSHL